MTLLIMGIYIYVFSLSVILLLAMLWLVLKKFQINYELKSWSYRRKRFKREVDRYLNSPTNIAPRMKADLRGNFRHWAYNHLINYATNLTDKGVYRLSSLVEEWGIIEEIETDLRSSNWWDRYEALHLATAFKVSNVRETVIDMCGDENALIRMAAITTLSSIGEEDDIFVLFDALEEHTTEHYELDWVFNNLNQISNTNDSELFQQVQEAYFGYKNPFTKRCILEWIGSKNRSECIPFLINVMKSEEGEIKVGAIKALIALKAQIALPYFVRFVENRFEQEGIQNLAMKGLALLGGENYSQCFEVNLGHSHWWVRYYSAMGLFKSGTAGKNRLRILKQEHPDQYARDMASYYTDLLKLEGFDNYVHS
jgi:hypothetical protein